MEINTLNSENSDPRSFKNIYYKGIKIHNTGPMSIICQLFGVSGIRLQGLNRKLYNKVAEYFYAYEIRLWKLNYKNLLQVWWWEEGVNEKKFLAIQPSLYNKMVGWEHNCDKKTSFDSFMFNMILQDGTRSDNPMTWNGYVHYSYDYFLPQNNKITKVTTYYYS